MDNQALHALASDIAAHLGDGWTVVTNGDNGHRDFYERVPHLRRASDGAQFYLHGSWSGKGRIYVGADWPKDAQGREVRPYFSAYSENGAAPPSITFTETKAPALAAKDIARRFLPAFLPLWDKQVKAVASSNQYLAERASLALQVANILDGEVKTAADGNSIVRLGYRESGIHEVDFDVDNETVSIKVRGLTLDQLRHIHQLFSVITDSDEPSGYRPEGAVLYDGTPDSGSIRK